MLQNISKSFSPVSIPATELTTQSAKTAAVATTYTAISYGDAARALGAAIMSQYGTTSVVAVSQADHDAAKNFGTALTSLAAVVA